MTQVKLIVEWSPAKLEESMNKWLSENINYKIIDIKYNSQNSSNGSSEVYSALVIYEVINN